MQGICISKHDITIYFMLWLPEYRSVFLMRCGKMGKVLQYLPLLPQITLYIRTLSKNIEGGMVISHGHSVEMQEWCNEFGVEYSTSVWDITSAKEICTLHPNLIKVPSACNLNKGLLEYLCDNFGGEIHLSFGMTTRDEEEQIIRFFESKGRNKDLVIYDCTSGYPVPFEDICLLEITRLRELYADRVKAIGFSGHHLGIAVDSAAVALGAEWIERHYTLDRTWKGTDHAASLEPDGVRKLARDCRAVAKALTYKKEDILDIEKVQRNKLKKNQVKW